MVPRDQSNDVARLTLHTSRQKMHRKVKPTRGRKLRLADRQEDERDQGEKTELHQSTHKLLIVYAHVNLNVITICVYI